MDPLTIAIGLGILWLASRAGKVESPSTGSSTQSTPETARPDPLVNPETGRNVFLPNDWSSVADNIVKNDSLALSISGGVVTAAGIIPGIIGVSALGAPVVAAGGAVVAAGGFIGNRITKGSALGTIAGATSGIGLVGGAGATVAGEIDNMLGGHNQTAANIAGGVAGGLAVLVGSIAGSIAVAILYYIPVTAIIYGVGVAIGDFFALQYGQDGAFKDLQKKELEVFAKAVNVIRQQAALKNLSPSEAEVSEMANQFARGYVRAANEISFYEFMSKPWGIGATAISHGKWGSERGKFVGYCDAGGSLSLAGLPLSDYPRSDLSDSQFVKAAAKQANIVAYSMKMNEAWGIGQSPQSHCVYWNKKGAFKGTCSAEGNLEYEGDVYNFGGVRISGADIPVQAPSSPVPFLTPEQIQQAVYTAPIQQPIQPPPPPPPPLPPPSPSEVDVITQNIVNIMMGNTNPLPQPGKPNKR